MSQDALWSESTAPPPADSDSGRGGQVTPDVMLVVYGSPAPQGSKKAFAARNGKGELTGKVGMREQNATRIDQWRGDVMRAAQDWMAARLTVDLEHPMDAPPEWRSITGPVEVSAVFTLRDKPKSRPSWWPVGEPWQRDMWWRPAGPPDLDKLERSTMDALTTSGLIKDDSQVVGWREPHGKWYCGHPGARSVLPLPGAVIRIWRLA